DGVNPANGVVIYYNLTDSAEVKLVIKDSQGNEVRSFTSEKDKSYKRYDGGPPAEPTLSNNKGLNRFVWDMRYPTADGIPLAYIEGSYRGHKAIPGKYTIHLSVKGQEVASELNILPNPLYETTMETYKEYHTFMLSMEKEIDIMHKMVNKISGLRSKLEEVLNGPLAKSGNKELMLNATDLIAKMKSWDEDMVQRKAKAYDDVDNFENKFTANYIYMINQTESDLPKVNEPSRARYKELMAEWKKLAERGNEMIEKDIPTFNKLLWDAGIGVIHN
ncbi:MAG: glycosyl hydrolase, partial [Cyclobacteriaceae bacterium]|nr:glycosyl hydrolase [Cyclobacteriaceae bacterium]